VDQYADEVVPRRPNSGIAPLDKPSLQQQLAGLRPLGPETVGPDEDVLNRLRMLSAVDEGVGELREALEEAGQLDNTLFIVTSDHGYFYGEHGLNVERRLPYEESIRIPLLVRFPSRIQAGSTPDSMVQTIDLAPTIVAAAGAEIPSQYQGQSLWPLLEGKTPADWRDSVLVEYWSDTVFPRIHKLGYQAVRNDRWKFIHYTDQPGIDELYDLQSDPYELKNLVADPTAEKQLAAMQTELDRLLPDAGDK
jgi:N-acetylglucosamine-6-sulfatase